jgi:N-acetylmuramoyl-L-alanine amidase
MSKKKILFLDAGHGAHDPGAINTSTGLKEKDVVLDVCLLMKEMLSPDVEVILSRNSDLFLPLSKRSMKANLSKADAFLSVHCNSASAPTAHGFEVFTAHGNSRADDLASKLYKRFEALGRRGRKDMADGDPDKEAGFHVLTKTKMPAALFELEFIHNQQGHDFLSNQDSQVKMARALSDGILDHFEITHTAFPPDRNTDVGFSAGTKQEDNAKMIARIRAVLDTLEERLT